MADLFDLVAKLTLDSSEYSSGLDSALGKAKSIGGTIAKAGVASFAALTGAAVGAATALTKTVSEVAEYGDNIDKMSQKMGLSATAYQEWDAVMQHSGTSIESLKAGMKTLANAVENNNDAFGRLGITQEQIASMNQEELFSATISALQNVEDETTRTYLAGQLLGRGATELGPLLNMTAEETEAMKNRVHELGGVMADDAVKAAAAFQDNLQDLTTAIDGVKRGFTQALLPGFNDVLAGFTSLIAGEEGAEAQLTGGIENIITTFNKMLPRVTDVLTGIGGAVISVLPDVINGGLSIVKSLGSAIMDNSGIIMDAAFDVINIIVDAFSDHTTIARIGSFAGDMLITLANGLSQNLPTVLPAITGIIMDLVNVFTDPENLGNMVNAAVAILTSLADGLMGSLDVIIAAVPEIVSNLGTAIGRNAPKLISAAATLIHTLVTGLIDRLPEIIESGITMTLQLIDGILQPENIQMLVESGFQLVGSLYEALIKSVPSLLDAGWQLIKGLWQGISNAAEWLWDMLKGLGAGLVNTVKSIFGIHSPSTIFRDEIGKNLMLGLADGISDNVKVAEKALSAATESLSADATVDYRIFQPTYAQTGYVSSSQSVSNADEDKKEILQLLREIAKTKTAVFTPDGQFAGWIDNALGERVGMSRRYV